MFDIVTLSIKFDNGELTHDEAVRYAALLLHTDLVYSAGRYGRFVNDMIDAGHTDEIAEALAAVRADPFAEVPS